MSIALGSGLLAHLSVAARRELHDCEARDTDGVHQAKLRPRDWCYFNPVTDLLPRPVVPRRDTCVGRRGTI